MTDAEEGKYPEPEFDSVGDYLKEYEDGEPDYPAESASQTRLAQHIERMGSVNIYDGEGLNYLESLRTPISADDLITQIKDAKFFKVTTNALINIVTTHISPDALLSQTDEGGCAELYFDTIVTEATALSPSRDVNSPEFVIIKSAMKGAYLYELSRTRGPYRERRMQDPNRMEVITGKLSAAPQTERRKGISLPGFRR